MYLLQYRFLALFLFSVLLEGIIIALDLKIVLWLHLFWTLRWLELWFLWLLEFTFGAQIIFRTNLLRSFCRFKWSLFRSFESTFGTQVVIMFYWLRPLAWSGN
uniref:Uncharacterized protein n=1 Tax=Anopheles darlingi TaxID=43151 RepID=A0A2M4D616_ANODA